MWLNIFMTKNNFGRLKKVLVGDFPDHNLMRHTYDAMGNTQAWILYKKIADESKQDLDNLSTFYKDHGVTVLRPKFDPFVNNRWSKIKFKAPFNTANRFFAYGDLVFYLTTADDSEVPYTDFFRSCMEHMHDSGKNVFTNPLTLETSTMQSYTDSDWPGDEGFGLDGPCFFPVENRIFYNRKHVNTDRGIQWIQRIIKKFYPDTEFVDLSDKFINHIDSQIRVFNPSLAATNGATEFFTDELGKTYNGIKVIDVSVYIKNWHEKRAKIFSKQPDAVMEAEWLRAWIDFDDQNGNPDTGSVSIDEKTVVEQHNDLDLYKQLEQHGIKVERVPMRHSGFWGSGLCCETAVLERESQ